MVYPKTCKDINLDKISNTTPMHLVRLQIAPPTTTVSSNSKKYQVNIINSKLYQQLKTLQTIVICD